MNIYLFSFSFSYKVHISTNNMAQNSIMQNLEAIFNCKELLSGKICTNVVHCDIDVGQILC